MGDGSFGWFGREGVSRARPWWEYRRCWQAITVQRSQSSPERVDMRGGRLVVTDAARDAIRRLCRDTGRQALLLSWPGGAVCLPSSLYTPTAFDVIIGHIARCPIFVDLRRRLGFPAGARVVLDASHGWPRRPLLRLRPTGRPELARRPRREEAAMTSAMVRAQVTARVSREVYRELRVVLPEPVIAACVRDTLVDLHRSISTEALPEMVVALAKVRLTGITDARSHTRVRRSPRRGPSGPRLGRARSGLGALHAGGRPMNTDMTTRPGMRSPAMAHRPERLEIHNIEVDQAVAGQHLCGNLHLPSGRVCLLPERHRGGCQFTARPAR
jgi:hypothetical protein